MLKNGDRIYETSVTTGAGDYTLAGAVTGFQAFNALGNGNTCTYFVTDDVNWEVGIGTVLTGPDRLQRTAIIASSNAGAAVNWGAGTRKLRCGLPAANAPRNAVEARAGNTILGHGDFGKELIATGEWTQTFTAAALLGDGWVVTIKNNGSGNITLDPNGAESINGAATLIVPPGHTAKVSCNGTLLYADIFACVDSGRPGVVTGGIAKNAIIGGDFSTNPWQRGTSFVSCANGTYTADRWRYDKSGAMVHDVSKSASAPTVAQAGRLTNHCLLVDCTTADAAIAAGDYCYMMQRVEGYNFLPLAQRAMTLGFWHAHTKTGTYCCALVNAGGDRTYVFEYTQAVADTWEFMPWPVAASPSAGTWDYTSGIGLQVIFTIAAGTTYHTAANAWQVGNFLATANQVNACDNVANNFRLALVQLEPGSVATECEAPSFQQVLALSQRYFWKTFAIGTAPAQNVGILSGEHIMAAVVAGTSTNNATGPRFPVRMRVAPTVTTYNPAAANAQARNISDAADCSATTADNITDAGIGRIQLAGNVGMAAGETLGVHLTASAEL